MFLLGSENRNKGLSRYQIQVSVIFDFFIVIEALKILFKHIAGHIKSNETWQKNIKIFISSQ